MSDDNQPFDTNKVTEEEKEATWEWVSEGGALFKSEEVWARWVPTAEEAAAIPIIRSMLQRQYEIIAERWAKFVEAINVPTDLKLKVRAAMEGTLEGFKLSDLTLAYIQTEPDLHAKHVAILTRLQAEYEAEKAANEQTSADSDTHTTPFTAQA